MTTTARRRLSTPTLLATGLVLMLAMPLSAAATWHSGGRVSKQPCPHGVHVRNGWGTFRAGKWPSACWRPYTDKSFFNTPLPRHPRLLRNSGAMVAKILSMGDIKPLKTNPANGDDYYHPYFFARPSDPVYRIRCNKHDFDCPIEGRRVRIPASARPASGSDAHMVVIDQRSGWEYDFWGVQTVPLPRSGGTITVGWGGRTRLRNGPGGGTARTESPAVMSSTGAIGGVIRFQELAAGRIEHALFMVVGCSNGRMVYPGRDFGGTCGDTSNAPASGQWLQLSMTKAAIKKLDVPNWKKTILTALAEYGAFVGDTGGNEAFGLELESQQTYTSVGAVNPYVAWAAKQASKRNNNIITYREDRVTRYALDIADGVDWEHKLRVVDPCVIRRTCRGTR